MSCLQLCMYHSVMFILHTQRKKSCVSLGMVNIPEGSSVLECISVSLGIFLTFEGM